MVSASTSVTADSDLIPSQVKPMNVKLVSTASLLKVQLAAPCGEQAGKFTCRAIEKHLAGFPHLGVLNRWLAASKRAH